MKLFVLRKNIVKALLTILMLAACFDQLLAESLSLKDFFNEVLENHPFLKKEVLNQELLLEEQKELAGAEDWQLRAEVYEKYTEYDADVVGYDKEKKFHLGSSFKRKFWKTGGELSYYIYSEKVDRNALFDDYIHSQTGINYVHPLRNNKNGFLDKLSYKLKAFDIDVAALEEVENIEQFMLEVANVYLDWVYTHEVKKIFSQRLELSITELEETRKKFEKNIVDRVDLIRAKDYVSTAKQNLLLISTEAKALKEKISVIINNYKKASYIPEFKLYELISTDLKEDFNLKDFRPLRMLDDRLNYLSLLKKGFEEEHKTSISLIAELNINNEADDLTDSLSMNNKDAFLGIEFSRPLEKNREKSKIKQVSIEIDKILHAKDEMVLDINSELVYMKTLISDYEEIFLLNQSQIELSHEKTKEEMKIYQQGRGDYTFVLQSRDNEQNAKLTYAENALKYQKLILQYKALIDKLYPNN